MPDSPNGGLGRALPHLAHILFVKVCTFPQMGQYPDIGAICPGTVGCVGGTGDCGEGFLRRSKSTSTTTAAATAPVTTRTAIRRVLVPLSEVLMTSKPVTMSWNMAISAKNASSSALQTTAQTLLCSS